MSTKESKSSKPEREKPKGGKHNKVVPLVATPKVDAAKDADDMESGAKTETKLIQKRQKRGLPRVATVEWPAELRARIAQIEEEIALKIFSDKTITQAFRSADDDRSGEIDKEEFQQLLEQHKIVCSADELQRLWDRYDADGGGTVTIDEFTLQYAFSANKFKDFLDDKDEEQERCRSLPLTIIFFTVFVVLVAFHEQTTEVFQLESSLKVRLTESEGETTGVVFEDINSIQDIFDWAAEVLLPTIFLQTDPVSGQALEEDDWGSVLTYSHLLGTGLVLSQERAQEEDCILPQVTEVYGQCHPDSTVDTSTYGLELCDNYTHYEQTLGTADTCACFGGWATDCVPSDLANPPYSGVYDALPYNVSEDSNDNGLLDDTFVQRLFWDKPIADSTAKLDVLHRRRWIDELTKSVTMTFAVYNPELLVFTKVDIEFSFDRGGYVDCGYHSQSMLANAYNEAWLWGLDALWILMVLSLAWSEIQEMRDTAGCTKKGLEALEKDGDTRTTAQRYCDYWHDGWNYIDWAQVLLTLFLSGYWFAIYFDTQGVAMQYAIDQNASDVTLRNAIVWELDRIGEDVQVYRTLAVVNLFVLMLRFFKAFLGQPRLAIITRTFAVAASDLMHFFVVFLCLFFTFVFAGMFIFGQHLYNYHSVHTAMATSFNALTGEYEWEEVEGVDLTMAIIWWWVYMMLMYLVVLNMLLAIVLNAYNVAKNSATRRVTCWKQLSDAVQESIAGCRGSIKLSQIQDLLEDYIEDCVAADSEDQDPINAAGILRLWKETKVEAEEEISEFAGDFAKEYLLSLTGEFVASLKFDQERKDRLNKYAAIQRTRQLNRDFFKLTQRLDKMATKLEALQGK